MKKIIIAMALIGCVLPANAYQLQESQIKAQSGKQKIYSSNGSSYQGYIKPISSNRMGVYNKYGQKEKTYKVRGNKLVEDKYIWH